MSSGVGKQGWKISEVVSFLEEKIIDGVANEDEMEMYEDYKWYGRFNKDTYAWKRLLQEMRRIHNGEA